MPHKVFGMDRTLPTWPEVFSTESPAVFNPALVHECIGAVRQSRESHRWNCFHSLSQTLFLALELVNAIDEVPKAAQKRRRHTTIGTNSSGSTLAVQQDPAMPRFDSKRHGCCMRLLGNGSAGGKVGIERLAARLSILPLPPEYTPRPYRNGI